LEPLSFPESDYPMEQPQGAPQGSESWTQANGVEPALSTATSGDAPSGIIHMLRLFWVKRQMMSGILATGILLSVLYAYYLPVVYTSTTTLMPPDSTSSSPSLMGLLAGSGVAGSAGSALLGGMKSPGAVFVSILGSRTAQESLVKQFDLVHHYKTPLIEDACKRLAADTAIREDLKSGIITIDAKADNPILASNIARGYVAELNLIVTNNGTSAARRERIFLEERLKEIKQDLDDSSEALSRFSTKSRTIDVPSQARATVDSGLKLQEELATSRSELAGLRQTYSEDNVRVRAASARVGELQRQMDRIMGLSQGGGYGVDTGKADYPSLGALPALGLTYADLERKVIVEEALWEALTKQYEAAKVQEAKEIPSVRVLDEANIPKHKSDPARRSIVTVGTLLSICAACFFVLASSRWAEMDPQDERKILVTDIVHTTLNPEARIWRIPGMSWIYQRIRGGSIP
jgi:uncharacterized protein involved in exopolysaccharide biosynthesis